MELLLMDTNEKSTNPQLFEKMLETFGENKLRVVNLDWDYSIPLETGLLAVERKAVGDLLGSIADGRVFKQVESMAAGATFCFIILHGSLLYDKSDFVVADGRVTRWRGKSVRGALLAIQLAGCIVVQTSAGGFIPTLQEIVESVSKPEHIHFEQKRSVTFRDVTMTDAQREEYKRVEFIAALPGIGRKKAESLMRYVAGAGETYGKIVDALEVLSCIGLTDPYPIELKGDWGHVTVERLKAFMGFHENEFLKKMMLNSSADKLPKKGRTKK